MTFEDITLMLLGAFGLFLICATLDLYWDVWFGGKE